MDCNKDEATRAKEIAERKFWARDIVGAKKFALKAQTLFPGLEGIPQMLSVLDVYVSAEIKINGEADWYGILGVDQQADDETVRKQYRKLALMLHPDKNKSVGADGAFKLISEAWSLLSDKAKRVAYDQKRNAKPRQKVSNPRGGASTTAAGMNGNNATKCTKASRKPSKSSTARSTQPSAPAPAPAPPPAPSPAPAPPPTAHHKPKSNTFWTVCYPCKMQYEYLRVYLNYKILCPSCHEPFQAVETAPPPSRDPWTSVRWKFSQKQ